MVADGIDCFHRSLDFLFSISLISFQHHVQLRRKCSYRSTHWQWEDYLCGVCSTATSSANTWLQMCLRNSIAVSCWPGKSFERKLAWTVHPSVVTCAPCVHSAFVAYVFCYKVNLISCFDNYLFPTICTNFLFFRVLLRYFVFLALWAVVLFSALGFGCLLFSRLGLVVFFSLAWLWLSSFPSLGFGCLLFPRLASVVFFSLAWLRLSSFPALCYVILVFPRLAPVALFSCAWLGFLVFPRLVCLLVFPRLSPNELFFPRLAPVALFFPRV